jgi:hypothetical protein
MSAPVEATAITVEERPGRAGPRLADEAAILAAQLERHLPEVTVTRRDGQR